MREFKVLIKGVKYLKKRLLTLFYKFGLFNFFDSSYLSYYPDSFSDFKSHQEFKILSKKFIRFNKRNNAGDIARLWAIILNVKQLLSDEIEGNFAELGVWRGNTAAILAYYAKLSNKKVFLFDTFEGFSKKDLKDIDADKKISFQNTNINLVKNVIGEESDVCEFVKGYFPSSIQKKHRKEKFCLVSLDCDLYAPTKAGLEFFYPLMEKHGIFLLHDYSSLHWEGSKRAIDEFCELNNEKLILIPDKSGSAFFRKNK